jgi:hypothetical protein
MSDIQSECRREARASVRLSQNEKAVFGAWRGPEDELCCYDVEARTGLSQLSARPRMTSLCRKRGLLVAVRKAGHAMSNGLNVTYYRLARPEEIVQPGLWGALCP